MSDRCAVEGIEYRRGLRIPIKAHEDERNRERGLVSRRMASGLSGGRSVVSGGDAELSDTTARPARKPRTGNTQETSAKKTLLRPGL